RDTLPYRADWYGIKPPHSRVPFGGTLLASHAVTEQSEKRDSQFCTGQPHLLLRRQLALLLDAPGRSVRRLHSKRPRHVEIAEVLAPARTRMRAPGVPIHA